MAAVGVVFLFGLLFLYEYSRVRRHGGGAREMLAFGGLMLIALAFALALALDVKMPPPAQRLGALLEKPARLISLR